MDKIEDQHAPRNRHRAKNLDHTSPQTPVEQSPTPPPTPETVPKLVPIGNLIRGWIDGGAP